MRCSPSNRWLPGRGGVSEGPKPNYTRYHCDNDIMHVGFSYNSYPSERGKEVLRSVLSLLRGARGPGHGRNCTTCDGKPSFLFLRLSFLQKHNSSKFVSKNRFCLWLWMKARIVGGNHKLVGCNKGSGDPFVENDQQMLVFDTFENTQWRKANK